MKAMIKRGYFTFWRAFTDQKVPTDNLRPWQLKDVQHLGKKNGIKGRTTWHVLNYDKKAGLQPILVNELCCGFCGLSPIYLTSMGIAFL